MFNVQYSYQGAIRTADWPTPHLSHDLLEWVLQQMEACLEAEELTERFQRQSQTTADSGPSLLAQTGMVGDLVLVFCEALRSVVETGVCYECVCEWSRAENFSSSFLAGQAWVGTLYDDARCLQISRIIPT